MIEIFYEVLNKTLILASIITFISAILQGYSGFGGGLLMVPLLAILFNPIEGIAIAALAGLIGSAILMPGAITKINWKETGPVSIGMSLAIPIGIIFLTAADPTLIRNGMGLFILAAGILMLFGWVYTGPRNLFISYIAGTLAGMVTGGFGVPGGPFIVAYLISSKFKPETQRANIIFTIGIGMCFLVGGLVASGSYSEYTVLRSIILIPALIIGNILGKRLFNVAPLSWFNKVTNSLLIVLGIIILII